MTRGVRNFILDSGAFTVWNSGGQVDLKKYIRFCKEYLNEIDVIVALDVIPGVPNSRRSLTRENIEKACQQGWVNYQRMLDAGLPKEKVVPVFHQNDNWKWLEKFMEEDIPYFGLSPANDSTSGVRQLWLNTCMKFVCNKDGMPLRKFHGFAVTSIPLMHRYPWYSCDSASWLRYAMYGSIMFPRRGQQGWDYKRPCHPPVFFSTKIGSTANNRRAHYSFLPASQKDSLLSYLDELGIPLGESSYRKQSRPYKHDTSKENIFERHDDHYVIEEKIVRGVSNDIRWRAWANLHFFQQVQKHLPWPRPFKYMGADLFPPPFSSSNPPCQGVKNQTTKIYMAGRFFLPEHVQVENMLLSYHYIIESDSQYQDFMSIVNERRGN